MINLDAQAQPPTLDDPEWHASLLAERGPLISTLMLNLARLVVFVEWAVQPGRHLVVVDDVAFGVLLLHEARRRNWDAGWLAPGRKLGLRDRAIASREWLARCIDGARRRASVVRRFLCASLRSPASVGATRCVSMNYAGRCAPCGLGPRRYVSAARPARSGILFRPLAVAATSGWLCGCLSGVSPDLLSPFGAIATNALAAQEPVALIEDFIPWWAIIPAALNGLMFPRRVGRLSALGIDATAVLRMEARRDRRLAVSAEACLLAYVGRGLARRGIRPGLVLHLYESQPWEKMLAFGIRQHIPHARIVGVQHAPFAWNYLSFFPSRRNIAQGVMPDLLLTPGEGYARWFRDAGIPSDRIAVLGAIRFEHAAPAVTPRGPAILCCTSIELDEAIELATKAALAMQGLDIPLVINFHPVTDEAFRTSVREAVRKAIGAASKNLTFSPASMQDLLERSGVVLYMSSAACFEAVAAGRTAIYVTRDIALDYDKLPNDVALCCRSREALREMLQQRDATTYGSQSSKALAHWLAPVVDVPELRRLLTASGSRPAAAEPDEQGSDTNAELAAATGDAG